VQRCGDTGGATAPIVTCGSKTLDVKRVGKVDEVLSDRRLLCHPRSGRIPESRWAIATQVWHEDPVTRLDQRRCYLVPGSNVIGKAVKEDDGESRAVATLFVPNAEWWCLDLPVDWSHFRLSPRAAKECASQDSAGQCSVLDERSSIHVDRTSSLIRHKTMPSGPLQVPSICQRQR
jgi:hypothetical protein